MKVLKYLKCFKIIFQRLKAWGCFFAYGNTSIRVTDCLIDLVVFFCLFVCFVFFFTDPGNSQDSRGRKGAIFYSTLPLSLAHEHLGIYLQHGTWGDYHIFLIETLVFNRLLLDEIYHLIELLFDWLMMWCWFSFVCLLIWFYVLLRLFDMTETGRPELASTIILVLQANQLTKCASHSSWVFSTTSRYIKSTLN